jgi:hypothetical protein
VEGGGGLLSEGNVMEEGLVEGGVKGLLDSSSEDGSVVSAEAKKKEVEERRKMKSDEDGEDEGRLSDVD